MLLAAYTVGIPVMLEFENDALICASNYDGLPVRFVRPGSFIMKKILLIIILALTWINSVQAYTECTVNIHRIWAGDNGYIFIIYQGGGSVMIPPAHPDQKNVLALATAAFMANRQIIVRYNADSVSCAAEGVNDLRGIYLL